VSKRTKTEERTEDVGKKGKMEKPRGGARKAAVGRTTLQWRTLRKKKGLRDETKKDTEGKGGNRNCRRWKGLKSPEKKKEMKSQHERRSTRRCGPRIRHVSQWGAA